MRKEFTENGKYRNVKGFVEFFLNNVKDSVLTYNASLHEHEHRQVTFHSAGYFIGDRLIESRKDIQTEVELEKVITKYEKSLVSKLKEISNTPEKETLINKWTARGYK